MAKETVPNQRYTDEFKLEALRLAESVGINQAAKRLVLMSASAPVPPSTIQYTTFSAVLNAK